MVEYGPITIQEVESSLHMNLKDEMVTLLHIMTRGEFLPYREACIGHSTEQAPPELRRSQIIQKSHQAYR